MSGVTFLKGETQWFVRSMKLRHWMRTRACGRPQLRVVIQTCPNLVRQIESTLRTVAREDVKDEIAKGQVHDVLDCMEYWAGSDPTYVIPPASPSGGDSGMQMYEADQAFWAALTTRTRESGSNSGPIVLGI
jgi:hypothetical protein